jgi:agmatine/peptidylarginine deiminase
MARHIILIFGFLITTFSLIAQNVFLPAEFEKNEGIILKWNYNESVDSVVAKIASVISVEDKVWILNDPDNTVTIDVIQAQLTANGANLSNIIFFAGTAENPWLRDYGPFTGYNVTDLDYSRHFVDAQYLPTQFPLADFLPMQLASDFSFNYDALPLNFEGANLLLDGIGRGFVSDRILNENPGMNSYQVIQALYTKLNLNEIIILPSIPECGGGEWSELSRLVKFIDPETVLVSQFPESVPYYQQVEMIADTLSKTYNDVGKALQVVRLPVAPNENGEYSVTNNGEIRSYTSSILFNNKILIPSYDNENDATALNIYQQLFQGYQVIQIPSQALSALHGSLYKLAVNVPQPKFFRIRHSKLTGIQPFESETWINSFVQSLDQVDSIELYYRIHPSTTYQVVNSIGCCGGYSGSVSGYNISDTISYYLQAYSGEYKQTLPIGAPVATYTFWFDPFTGLQTESEDQRVTIFPNPASDYIFLNGISKNEKEVSYKLLNMNGIPLAEGNIEAGAAIRLPDYLVNGFYIIKIITSGKTHISKLYLHH